MAEINTVNVIELNDGLVVSVKSFDNAKEAENTFKSLIADCCEAITLTISEQEYQWAVESGSWEYGGTEFVLVHSDGGKEVVALSEKEKENLDTLLNGLGVDLKDDTFEENCDTVFVTDEFGVCYAITPIITEGEE